MFYLFIYSFNSYYLPPIIVNGNQFQLNQQNTGHQQFHPASTAIHGPPNYNNAPELTRSLNEQMPIKHNSNSDYNYYNNEAHQRFNGRYYYYEDDNYTTSGYQSETNNNNNGFTGSSQNSGDYFDGRYLGERQTQQQIHDEMLLQGKSTIQGIF